MTSNYQDIDRIPRSICPGADPQATLPGLIEACKKLITPDRRRVFEERGKKIAAASAAALGAQVESTHGWDASPISHLRLAAEVWDDQTQGLGVGWRRCLQTLELRQVLSEDGRCQRGRCRRHAPMAVGAALAHKNTGDSA